MHSADNRPPDTATPAGATPAGATPAGDPSRIDTTWHVDCLFVLVAIAVLLLARIPVIRVRFIDPDEFEHTHAAWSVFRGLLPYRDFFEHHTPWYYFALSPFFRWFAVDQSFESARHFLLFARGVSLVLTTLSVGVMFLLGRLGANRKTGLLAGVFLLTQSVLIQKTLEIRPDILALPVFLGGLWFLSRGLMSTNDGATRGARWFFGGGLCLGAAIMCTQKMLFVLPGALTGLGLWALGGGRQVLRARLLAAAAVAVGVAVPVAFTWLGFAAHGGGGQFIHNNFVLNAKWKARSSRHVLSMLETSWPILGLSAVGIWRALSPSHRGHRRNDADLVLLCTLGGLLAGLLVIPAAYAQYYLMPLPIASLFAARGLLFLLELAPQRRRAPLLVGAMTLLLAWPAVDLGKSFADRDDRQMARLRYVFEHTAPSEPVLDGWLGTAVFRPHPLYYFFMHDELLAMLSQPQKDAYLDALESGKVRPSLIAVDPELTHLGPRFMRFVRANYATSDGLFYLPAPGPARPKARP